MKLTEPRTFRGAMLPVTVIGWALGIGTFEYPLGRPRRIMSICWSGTILILFLYITKIAALQNVWDVENSTFNHTAYQISIIMNTICGITFVYLGQVRSKSVVDFLCKVEAVNEMLNKFGIPKEYGLTFKSQIIYLIGTFVYIFTITIYPNMIGPYTMSIGSIINGLYIGLVSFLEDHTFSTCVRYIGKRFRHLNTYLRELSIRYGNAVAFPQSLDDHIPWLPTMVHEHHLPPRIIAVADKQHILRDLHNAKKIHYDLCNTAKILNEAFGVQIFISMATAMPYITFILYHMYFLIVIVAIAMIEMKILFLVTLPWICFYITKILYITSACSMASTEAQKTGEIIHELVNPTTCNEIREEIHTFSLQLMQDPLQFTACGFFTFDWTMIRAMVGTVTTYLVIMIQLPRISNKDNSLTANAMIPAVNTNNRSDKFDY